jgi:hypothetical protein
VAVAGDSSSDCAVCLPGAVGTLTIGRGIAAEDAAAAGRWNFSPQPPLPESAIVLHAPRSEIEAPLFWSLLGATALCCGAFIPA